MKFIWVFGEYGVQADQAHTRNYYAQNHENARRMFIARMKRDHPQDWAYMGPHNVSSQDTVCPTKNENR